MVIPVAFFGRALKNLSSQWTWTLGRRQHITDRFENDESSRPATELGPTTVDALRWEHGVKRGTQREPRARIGRVIEGGSGRQRTAFAYTRARDADERPSGLDLAP